MDPNQPSRCSVYDRLPPLSTRYTWCIAHSLEAEEEEGTGDQLFYTLHDPMLCDGCRIPKLLGRRIRGYFHGWVILSNDPRNVLWSLWNPVTGKMIRLPPLILKDGDSESIGGCCLSCPPDDPSSVVLLTRTDRPTFVFCRLDCKKRKRLRWTEMSYSKQLRRMTVDGGLVYNLTCCNGKVYALNTDSSFGNVVIQVDIVVNDREVIIKLWLFGVCPQPLTYCPTQSCFLKGSSTELFCTVIGFKDRTKKILGYVSLFRLDMTTIPWEQIEGLKDLDITGVTYEELEEEDLKDVDITTEMWEEMLDLKDAIFFVDLGRDHSVFYTPAIASELGGYIHIRSEPGKIIHSYCFKDKSIFLSSMPSPVLPTSHVTVWECRLEDDFGESKCTIDFKQEKDEIAVQSVTDKVGFDKSYLLNLPFHILELIMEFCVGTVDYVNFRATCKRCHLAAPKTPLRRLQTCSLLSPWLLVLDKVRGIITLTHPMVGDKYFLKNSPISIFDNHIQCSRYGWLLFYNYLRGLVFYNPFIGETCQLPEADRFFGILCFSAPPTSPDCMVVGFVHNEVYIHFVANETSWRVLPVDFGGVCFATFYGQDLYALCSNGEVRVFRDLGEEDFSHEQVVAELTEIRSWGQYFITKCDQHLLLVIVGEDGGYVEVFVANDSTKEWEKIDDLGRHMIFICNRTCYCIQAKSPKMENKIYFPRVHSRNGKMVFYSLETHMYHTFNGKNIEEAFGNFAGTLHHEFNPHAWIDPTWS